MTNLTGADRAAHRLFLLTLAAKAVLGAVQLATALALALGVTERLPALAQALVARELREDPDDFIASRVMKLVGLVPATDMTFYTIYFAAHGLLHLGVVAALLFGSRHAYPAAVLVLAAFVVYQLYEWSTVGGPVLLVLSAIDLAVIALTWIEWTRRSRAAA